MTRATLLCAGLVGACVASDLPAPPPHSPASVHAQEAAPRSIASSLSTDPLNEPNPPSKPGTESEPAPPEQHHHHHSQAAPHDASGALARQQDQALAAGIADPPADGGTPSPRAKTEYACPMHPEVRQAEPGRCPKCGMKLVPKSRPEGAQPQPKSSAVHAHSPPPLQQAASVSPTCAAAGAAAPNATCGAAADTSGAIRVSTSKRGASDDRAD